MDDYAAYFRLIRGRLEETVGEDDDVRGRGVPEPVDHCDVCPWSSVCSQKRRTDDHLSLVAGISRLQRHELEARNIPTLALAEMPLPLKFKPKRGAAAVRACASSSPTARCPRDATAGLRGNQPVEPEKGLCRLPERSPHDLFLDLEGDPFAGEGGREYLFGVLRLGEGEPVYRGFWAQTELENARHLTRSCPSSWKRGTAILARTCITTRHTSRQHSSACHADTQCANRTLIVSYVAGGSWISITSSDRACGLGWSVTLSEHGAVLRLYPLRSVTRRKP